MAAGWQQAAGAARADPPLPSVNLGIQEGDESGNAPHYGVVGQHTRSPLERDTGAPRQVVSEPASPITWDATHYNYWRVRQ